MKENNRFDFMEDDFIIKNLKNDHKMLCLNATSTVLNKTKKVIFNNNMNIGDKIINCKHLFDVLDEIKVVALNTYTYDGLGELLILSTEFKLSTLDDIYYADEIELHMEGFRRLDGINMERCFTLKNMKRTYKSMIKDGLAYKFIYVFVTADSELERNYKFQISEIRNILK